MALANLYTKVKSRTSQQRRLKGIGMDLHTCVIVLRNQKVITSKSVDHSIGIIERDSGNEISEIQINAIDGVNIRTYHYNNVEESLESLMNL